MLDSPGVFRGLLAEQTKELRSGLRDEMEAAVEKTEKRLMKVVEGVRSDLTTQMVANHKAVKKVEADYQTILNRLEVLEKGGPGSVGSRRGPAIVFGGWRTDTKRSLILSDLTGVLKDAQVEGTMDQQPWVPGVRHSVAIANFSQRTGENADGVTARMLAVISAVNFAAVQSENTALGRSIWAAISRPRTERGPGFHCGKVRKLLYQAGGWNPRCGMPV